MKKTPNLQFAIDQFIMDEAALRVRFRMEIVRHLDTPAKFQEAWFNMDLRPHLLRFWTSMVHLKEDLAEAHRWHLLFKIKIKRDLHLFKPGAQISFYKGEHFYFGGDEVGVVIGPNPNNDPNDLLFLSRDADYEVLFESTGLWQYDDTDMPPVQESQVD